MEEQDRFKLEISEGMLEVREFRDEMREDNRYEAEEIPKSQAEINEELYAFKSEFKEEFAQFRAQNDEQMADIRSTLDRIMDLLQDRMKSGGLDPPLDQVNSDPDETIGDVGACDEKREPNVQKVEAFIYTTPMASIPADEVCSVFYELTESSPAVLLKAPVIEPCARYMFDELPRPFLVEQCDRNAGNVDKEADVLSFVDLRSVLSSRYEATVNGSINGSTKAWFEEVTSIMEVVLGKNVMEDGAHKVFNKMSKLTSMKQNDKIDGLEELVSSIVQLPRVFGCANEVREVSLFHISSKSMFEKVSMFVDIKNHELDVDRSNWDSGLITNLSKFSTQDVSKGLSTSENEVRIEFEKWHGKGNNKKLLNYSNVYGEFMVYNHLFVEICCRGFDPGGHFLPQMDRDVLKIDDDFWVSGILTFVFDPGGCSRPHMGCGSLECNNEQEDCCWAANVAEFLIIEVPWIMCQEDDVLQPMINICTGWYFDSYCPNNPNTPNTWIGNWTGRFKSWGGLEPLRIVGDVVFAIVKFEAASIDKAVRWLRYGCFRTIKQIRVIFFPSVFAATSELKVFGIIAQSVPEANLSASKIAAKLLKQAEDSSHVDRMLPQLTAQSILDCHLVNDIDGKEDPRLLGLKYLGKFLSPDEEEFFLAPSVYYGNAIIEGGYSLKYAVLEGCVPFDQALGMNGYLEYELLVDAQLDCILVFHFVKIVVNWRTSSGGLEGYWIGILWPVQVKIRATLPAFLGKTLQMVELIEWQKQGGRLHGVVGNVCYELPVVLPGLKLFVSFIATHLPQSAVLLTTVMTGFNAPKPVWKKFMAASLLLSVSNWSFGGVLSIDVDTMAILGLSVYIATAAITLRDCSVEILDKFLGEGMVIRLVALANDNYNIQISVFGKMVQLGPNACISVLLLDGGTTKNTLIPSAKMFDILIGLESYERAVLCMDKMSNIVNVSRSIASFTDGTWDFILLSVAAKPMDFVPGKGQNTHGYMAAWDDQYAWLGVIMKLPTLLDLKAKSSRLEHILASMVHSLITCDSFNPFDCDYKDICGNGKRVTNPMIKVEGGNYIIKFEASVCMASVYVIGLSKIPRKSGALLRLVYFAIKPTVFIWGPGVSHFTTLRTRRLLRGRICHVPRLKLEGRLEKELLPR